MKNISTQTSKRKVFLKSFWLLIVFFIVGCSHNQSIDLIETIKKDLQITHPNYRVELFGLEQIDTTKFVAGYTLLPHTSDDVRTGIRFVEKKGINFRVTGGSDSIDKSNQVITFAKTEIENNTSSEISQTEVYYGAILNKEVFAIELFAGKTKVRKDVYGHTGYFFLNKKVNSNFTLKALSKDNKLLYELKG